VATGDPIFCRPISEAPVTPGVEYGPCLLGPGLHGEDWTIGGWNGTAWADTDGILLAPLVFMDLVPLRAVLALLSQPQ